jgi:G3E family GTPase
LDHSDAYRTWTLERTDPLAREDLERFASGFGEHIYRAKGFVHLREDPVRRYLYQQVGARWSLEAGSAWGEDTASTLVVLIGAAHAAGTEALDVLEPSLG